MKKSLRQSLNAEGFSMTKSTNLVSLDQRRRAQRVLQFFADLLGGGSPQDVAGLTTPLPEVKHLPRLGMDIAVTRDPAPAHMRAILAFARRRQTGFILVRFRDPAPGVVEALVSLALWDGNLAVLGELSPLSPDGFRWWLVGRHSGDVHIRITKEGFVPTLTEPWEEEDDRHALISKAEQILAERVWRD
jgi:hypothetical protein